MSLYPRIRLQDQTLQDVRVNASHKVRTMEGMALLHALREGISYHALQELSVNLSIEERQLHELIGFLNSIGCLQRKRFYTRKPVAWVIQLRHFLLGIHYSQCSYRQAVRLNALVTAVLRATTPVFLASGVVAGLWWIADFNTPSLILNLGYCIFTFLVTVILHELAHSIVLHLFSVRADILQLGMKLRIIHTPAGRLPEIVSALAGPLLGMISSLAGVYLALQLNLLFAALGTLVIGSFHCISLLPWYGDGHSLFKALRHKEK